MNAALKKTKPSARVFALTSVAVMLGFGASSVFAAIAQSGEQKNMERVGHVSLQGRAAYQPNVIVYPDGRTIAFVGTHAGSEANPQNGGAVEPNGTMIIDATDPANPKQKFHIPGTGGDSQMARMCLGSDLPGGVAGKVYLMRNYKTGYETFDVTNVNAPVKLADYPGFAVTHKVWWECKTGIAYMPGSRTADGWRQKQSMVIVDWKDPAAPPVYIRTYGLPGGQPSGTGPVPTSLHGAISTVEHPQADELLASGSDVIGNRVYAAWGVGGDGVVQILDRNKLLNSTADPVNPTDADLVEPQIGRLDMSPDQGGHTSMPVFGMQPESYSSYTENKVRDILVITSEATSNFCQEAPHWGFLTDITTESKPFNLSTLSVDPREGEKYKRGNYCQRGSRFGSHAVEENFRNPYYGKLTAMTTFSGGTRVFDIREPQAPVEVGFYVPVNNGGTKESCNTVNGVKQCANEQMSNNLEIDNRGYIYTADRVGTGLDIYRLTGKAKTIGFGPRPTNGGNAAQ